MSDAQKYSLNDVYPGTSPFAADWSDRFFGRSVEISDLENLVLTYSVVLLYGESGTGKSSLINAGLTQPLGKERCRTCRVSGLVPEGLAASDIQNIFVFHLLMSLAGKDAKPEELKSAVLIDTLPGLLRKKAGSAEDSPASESEPEDRWFLFVDQCEEILTTVPERWKDRAGFFEQIRAAVEQLPNVHFVLVAREEYLAAFERFEGVLPDGFRIRYYLERLTTPRAKEAILGPAGLAGVDPEDAAVNKLVDSVIQELLKTPVEIAGATRDIIGEFVEPLHLQIVCRELAQSHFKPGSATGSVVGDVNAALVRYYDAAVKAAARPVPLRELWLRWFIERKLITSAKTRGLVHESKAKGRMGGVRALVALEKVKILRVENRGGATWYELSHDRLIDPIIKSNARRFRNVKWSALGVAAAMVLVLAWGTLEISQESARLAEFRSQSAALAQSHATLNATKSAILQQTSESLTDPNKAAQIALPLWRQGNIWQAKVLLDIGRDKAPMENIVTIDDALSTAEKAGDQKGIAAYKTARKEFLRDPVIAEKMKGSKEIRDYICRHNYAVIGESGSKEMIDRAFETFLKAYPNVEVGSPSGANPNWSLVVDCFLTCGDAENLALQLHHDRGSRAVIVGWYTCPKHSCPIPDYDQPPIPSATRLPDGRVGAIYNERIPGAAAAGMALESGQLPPGLVLRADGKIVGMPTQPATAPFVFEVSQPAPGASIKLSLRVVAAFKDLPSRNPPRK
jgi:hypothetical protein